MDSHELEFTPPITLEQLLASVLDDVVGTAAPAAMAGAAIWNDIWDRVSSIWGNVSQLSAFNLFPGKIMGWLLERFLTVWLWVVGRANWLWDQVKDPVFGVYAWIHERARWLFDNIWAVASGLTAWIIDRADWLWDQVKDPVFGVYAWIHERARWLFDNIWAVADGLTAWIVDRAGWLWDQVKDPVFGVYAWIHERARWLFDNIWAIGAGLTAWIVDRSEWLWSVIWPFVQARFDDVKGFFTDTQTFITEKSTEIIRETGNAVIAGAQGIGEFFQSGLDWLFNHVFDPFADAIAVKMSIPRKLLEGQYTSLAELLDDFEDPLPTNGVVGYLWTLASAPFALISGMTETGSIMAQETVQKMAKGIGLTIPSFSDLRDGFLRGFMDESQHDEWLGRSGYSSENIDIIKQLYFDLPTPSDLVRMAVREVFSPDVVERFGLFNEFPGAFADLARQIGIDETTARWHWGAHWDLPSITQGFEMFHRDVIDRSTLDLLLRTKDVMPFWRDKLTAIANRVVSRIDIRRMFRLGVVDRDRVLRVYLDLGYAQPDAEALTEFVVRDAVGTDKELPRGTIERAYEDRLLGRDEALAEMVDIGLPAEQADLFLDLVDVRVERQLAGLAEDIVERDFKAGSVGEAAARSQLTELGVPAGRVDLLIDLWSRQAAVKDRDLSPSQLLRLFRADIISEPVLADRLGRQGYNEGDIAYLIQLADPEEAPPEPRELTKADLRAALSDGVLTEPQVRDRLGGKGYTPGDIDILVSTWTTA